MKKNTIITAASIVLFLAGISHLIRLFYELDITITDTNSSINNQWKIDPWVSFISVIITLFLAYNLMKIKKKR